MPHESNRTIDSLTDGRLEDDAGVWLSAEGQKKTFGFAESTLSRYRTQCSLIGRKVESKQVWARTGRAPAKRVWVHLVDDLKKVRDARKNPQLHGNDSFSTPSEVHSAFGFDEATLKEWARTDRAFHPALKRPLRTKQGKARIGNGALINRRLYSVYDIKKIHDWQEQNGDERDGYVIASWAEQELKLDRKSIVRWGNPNGPGHPALNGTAIRTRIEHRHVPGQIQSRKHRVYHRGDLEAIAEYLQKVDVGFTLSKASKFAGVSETSIVRYASEGCIWLGGRKLRFEDARGRKSNVRLYNTDDLKAIRDGRTAGKAIFAGTSAVEPKLSSLADSWMNPLHRSIIDAIEGFAVPHGKRGPSASQIARIIGGNLADKCGHLDRHLSDLRTRGVVRNDGKGRGATGYYLTAGEKSAKNKLR